MEVFQKINAPFKRYLEGPKRGKLIHGDWSRPEFDYLKDCEWEFTRKVDGTNIRVGYRRQVNLGDRFGPLVECAGRTDRAVLPRPLLEYIDKTFTVELFQEALPETQNIILFGEGYGAGIQSGGKYRPDQSFVLFDVMIDGMYLERHNVEDIGERLGIEVVPLLGYGTLQDAIDIVSTGLTWDRNGRMTKWGGSRINGLKSHWGDFEEEGIIAKPKVPMFDRMGNRIIVKIKGKDFK